jgi:hypothetical protein
MPSRPPAARSGSSSSSGPPVARGDVGETRLICVSCRRVYRGMLSGSTEGAAHGLQAAVVPPHVFGFANWLGGALDHPPYHDRWLPDGQPCYVLTGEGWAVDHQTTELLLRSLTARGA